MIHMSDENTAHTIPDTSNIPERAQELLSDVARRQLDFINKNYNPDGSTKCKPSDVLSALNGLTKTIVSAARIKQEDTAETNLEQYRMAALETVKTVHGLSKEFSDIQHKNIDRKLPEIPVVENIPKELTELGIVQLDPEKFM